MGSQTEENRVNPWKLIVGGGPLILLLLIGSVWSLFAYAFPQGKQQYAARYQRMLEELDAAALPADRLAVLREVGALSSRPGVSLPAVVMMVGVAADALRDRQISDKELNNIVLVRDFTTSKNGAIGFDEMGGFLAAHPAIKAILDHRGVAAMAPAVQTSKTASSQESAE